MTPRHDFHHFFHVFTPYAIDAYAFTPEPAMIFFAIASDLTFSPFSQLEFHRFSSSRQLISLTLISPLFLAA